MFSISLFVPGAEADNTGDAVKIAGGKSDAELLIEMQHLSTAQGPGLLRLDDSCPLKQCHFDINIYEIKHLKFNSLLFWSGIPCSIWVVSVDKGIKAIPIYIFCCSL